MKLFNVQITEFQSVRDSGSFNIEDITCLVGKNESGKTGILQALYKLNPIIEEHDKYDVTDHYPRSDVESYRQDLESGKRQPAIVVKAIFTLTENEIVEIEEDFGKNILNKPELILSKGYDNKLFFLLDINEKVAVNKIIEIAQITPELKEQLSVDTISDLCDKLTNIENDDNKEHIKRVNEEISKKQKNVSQYIFNTHLKSKVPKFLYFDDYYTMTGHENIEQLIGRVNNKKLNNSDFPLLGLIDMARISLEELIKTKRTEELISRLEGASNHLTKNILKYWSQNKHLEMKIDVRQASPEDPTGMTNGHNIWTRINDTKRRVTTDLGTRSKGFVWFFSFLAWFDQQQKYKHPLILLLDEPGLYLHGKAQGDLLSYIEAELEPSYQVIYTTHSPFMVDSKRFDRVRIVQDKSMDSDTHVAEDEDGTKVITDVLDATDDSLFPLQGALGYDISQTLFIGPNCLVVEGVSDLLYIQTISAILSASGREALNNDWVITPVGGADKVPTFVALLGTQKDLNIATLIDFQIKDQQSIENLYKKKLLDKQKVLTFAQFTDTKEADIEDMFDDEFYLSLINAEFSDQLQSQIDIKGMHSKKPRILLRIEDYFKEKPLKNGANFSHYRPARYLVDNITSLKDQLSKETLDRFEKAFKLLNKIV